MRKLVPHFVLALLASGSFAIADEDPYEPIILEDGILLIDKGSGWNWILETGSQQPEQRRSWRQLPLPGHPGHGGKQPQVAPLHPQPSSAASPTLHLPPQGPPMQGHMGPGMQPAQTQMHPGQTLPPVQMIYGMMPPTAPPQLLPGHSSQNPQLPPPVWQAPPMSRFPANSYSQAVPDSNYGALEARPEEPRRERREAPRPPEVDRQPQLPQNQFQYGEMRPTADGVRPSRAPERPLIETEKKVEKKEDAPSKKMEQESQGRGKSHKIEENKKAVKADAKKEKHRDSKSKADSKKPLDEKK